MRSHSKIFAIAVLTVGVFSIGLGACGGSSDTPSGPLAKHFDDMYIAAIPLSFVNQWIELKRKDGTLDAVYKYWILGQNAEPHRPRWSIIRNVLHWVK